MTIFDSAFNGSSETYLTDSEDDKNWIYVQGQLPQSVENTSLSPMKLTYVSPEPSKFGKSDNESGSAHQDKIVTDFTQEVDKEIPYNLRP